MANNSSGMAPTCAGHRDPADDRRECAGRAADDDVLRRAALQPHRIDEDVERDGECASQAAAATTFVANAITNTEATASTIPKASASPGAIIPEGIGRAARAGHDRVDIAVVLPHVDRTRWRRPPRRCTTRWPAPGPGCRCPGATSMPTIAGQHDQGSPRCGFSRASQSRPLPLPRRRGQADAAQCSVAHRTRGSTSKVWNGGGDATVHSSVVAPSPQ